MAKLTIVANVIAKPDSVAFVKAELEKLLAPTQVEEGCIQYDLHQDNNNPAHFLFFEAWESRDLWQVHMKGPHLQAYMKATEGHIADFALNEMTQVVK